MFDIFDIVALTEIDSKVQSSFVGMALVCFFLFYFFKNPAHDDE